MALRTSRRLPGFRFEFQPPPPADVLPRMDVAIFVGFAVSGPLHVPVAVEDVPQFTTIFGGDLPLAWDSQHSEQVYAYLAPAVRSFFRNGGRRCWIVRVAEDSAQCNYFPIPGLAQVDEAGNLTPAFARARSQGSWSDGLRIGASLISSPVSISQLAPSAEGLVVNLATRSPNDISVGDLVRVTFTDGHVLLFAITSADPIDPDSPVKNLAPSRAVPAIASPPLASSPPDGLLGRSMLEVSTRTMRWFTTNLPDSPPPSPTSAVMFTKGGELPPLPVSNYREQEGVIILDLGVSLAAAPEPGSLIRVDFATEQLWLMVQTVDVKRNVSSPPAETVEVRGQGLWALKDAPDSWPSFIQSAERLSFALWARQGNGYPLALSDLTFSVDHPRFWKALPADEQLYRGAQVTSNPEHSVVWKAVSQTPYTALWSDAANPRFPLAGDDAPGEVYVPIAMPMTPDFFLGVDEGPAGQRAAPRVRDGLREFHARLFLDENMIEVFTTDLLMQADYLRYQAAEPGSSEDIQLRTLKGIYAALDVEEASIIAVPDAHQRGWAPALLGDPVPPQASQPLPHPEWWRCQADEASDDLQAVLKPQQGRFHNCDLGVIEPPVPYIAHGPDSFGTFTLDWTPRAGPHVRYILEEALRPDWRDAVVTYKGTEPYITLYGHGQGNYYYRVRVEVGADAANVAPATSDWSAGIVVPVVPTGSFQLTAVGDYDEQGLLALQRALVRLCAARGDLFAVLALPEHYTEDDATSHIARLKAPRHAVELHRTLDPSSDEVQFVFPLGFGERNAFTYAALYHPWVIVRGDISTNDLRRMPPDGTACGILALRAIARGAWIAPANELLSGVLELTPSISRVNWQRLQDAQVNLIRSDPRGFLWLSADTLCDEEDADLRPINVRRLLSLLRRLALRLGATYVFEPNSDVFRRLVQRGFEAMLDSMFVRGAFAGATPDTSFQVVTDSSLNTSQGVEQGRFIVELRVAPSLPMTFLTLRLVQSATSGTVTEV